VVQRERAVEVKDRDEAAVVASLLDGARGAEWRPVPTLINIVRRCRGTGKGGTVIVELS